MPPTIWARANAIQVQDHHEVPRSTIAYISAGAGVGLVLIGILLGLIIRHARTKSKIREKRKTRQAQRDKLQAVNGKYEYKPAYSMKTIEAEKTTPDTPVRPPPPVERWKWNPPGDPEQTTAAVQVPPNVKFF